MSAEYAPVAVKEPSCRCPRCLGAFRIALAVQQPPPSIGPWTRRRDPKALAVRIWAEEFGKESP